MAFSASASLSLTSELCVVKMKNVHILTFFLVP